MDANSELLFELPPFFKHFKNGQIVRLKGQEIPAGVDPTTGITTKDILINPLTGVTARLHLPKLQSSTTSESTKLPIILDFHGGAFLIGSAFDVASFHCVNQIVSQANAIAISVEYRLAPENPLPAAYDDGWAALQWLSLQATGRDAAEEWLVKYGDFSKVFLVGGSAGGNIAHNIAMRVGAEGGLAGGVKVEGLVLLHPYFWGLEPIGAESDDVDFRRKEEMMWQYICPESSGLDDPRINPLAPGAPGLEGLGCRRVFIAVAEKDWLRERGVAYYEAVKNGTGFRAELLDSKGEGHGFFVFNIKGDKAMELFARVAAFVNSQQA